MSNSEAFVVYGTIVVVVICVLGALVGLFIIICDKKRKPILERKKHIQIERNRIYFDQCLLHLKNTSLGEFDAIYNLITDKNLQSKLYFIYLGFKLNTTKKREQNKIIKSIKTMIDEKY